jgi:hypothetical protein
MALTILTRSVLGKDVDFVQIAGTDVIPVNSLSPSDYATF